MYGWYNMLGAMPMLRGGRSCSINWENRKGEKALQKLLDNTSDRSPQPRWRRMP